MTQEHEELVYEGIRRMVIWDEPRDEVFHRLEVNGIIGAQAEEMYQRARSERVLLIRQDSMSKAGWGLLLFVASGGLFAFFWFGMSGIPRLLFRLCAVAAAIGAWQFFKGLFGFLFAASHEGSLADEE